jgi:hypothetical protein
MTLYDDPNREAVGLAPIWTGASADEQPEVDPGSGPGGGYDPGEHTVDDVLDYVDKHPDEADAVLAAEEAGKNRTTLVAALGG